jgi:seryl-tRNA synthetase
MNFKKLLDSSYEEKTKGLYHRKKKIEDRLGEFDPQEGERLKAKIEVLERKSREAFGDGKDEAVAGYEEEIKKIGDKLQADSEEIQSLNTERDEVHAKIDRAGEETLRKVFPEIQQIVLKGWIQAIEDAERGWEALQQFEVEHGVKLSFYVHHGSLSPRRADKSVQNRLKQWMD